MHIDIRQIDPSLSASEIYGIFQAAYPEEAKLIGVLTFPPLERSADSIAKSDNDFYAAIDDGVLVGVIEVDSPNHDSLRNIDSLAVAPSHARRGIGQNLVEYILTKFNSTTVSTGLKNGPVLHLYQMLGFTRFASFDTPEGIRMVTLKIG